MSNFKVNDTDLDDLLMQSTNRHTNATDFTINNNDIINKYGKWDNLERNKVAATRYTVANKDINEYFNKRNPTFQATLSGTFTYTGSAITPNISVNPASTTGYEIAYARNKIDARSYLAVASDFTLPDGYVWDSNHPQGSFTIDTKPVTFTFSGTGSFEYNGSSRSITIIPNDSNATYSITSGSIGPKTNVSDGSTTVTVTANGNYSGSATSASLSITQKTVTVTINGGGTFEYTGNPYTMSYSLSDSAAASSVSTSGTNSITNVGSISYTVSLIGNYSGSATSSITINEPVNEISISYASGNRIESSDNIFIIDIDIMDPIIGNRYIVYKIRDNLTNDVTDGKWIEELRFKAIYKKQILRINNIEMGITYWIAITLEGNSRILATSGEINEI